MNEKEKQELRKQQKIWKWIVYVILFITTILFIIKAYKTMKDIEKVQETIRRIQNFRERIAVSQFLRDNGFQDPFDTSNNTSQALSLTYYEYGLENTPPPSSPSSISDLSPPHSNSQESIE